MKKVFVVGVIMLLGGFGFFKNIYADPHIGPQNVTDNELPSWSDGNTRQRILEFVHNATTEGNAGFIPEQDRIAVFDNDGTLWSEQPLYFQFMFVLDRVKELAPQHPDWKTKEPFKSVITGDLKTALASGEKGLAAMLAATSAGMTTDEYTQLVKTWMATAVHPVTKKHYNEMIFQPMLELLQLLRTNGFQTFIVSGGEADFMRAWATDAYGIPPQQIVGSTLKTKFEIVNGKPVIRRLPQLNFVDDKAGKPVGIQQYLGKKPVFAAGNSDGDYEMLQWTSSNTLPHLGIIVHHTDAQREFAYDRKSHIGQLAKGLDSAARYGWQLVDMKNDWKTIYP